MFFLIAGKISAQNFQWAKSAGLIGQDAARSLAVDDNGNVYVTGQIGGNAQFDNVFVPSYGTYDAFLAKYSASGNLEWVRNAGGPREDYATGICIDANGFIYITGYFLDSIFFESVKLVSADFNDIFIAKYTPSGDLVWAKRAGGRGEDRSYAIVADIHGDFAITGSFSGTATFDNQFVVSSGNWDTFIAKYNGNGICQWVRKGGGTNEDAAKGIGSDGAGNFYIAGYIYGNALFGTQQLSTNPPTSTDIFIAKYSPWGDFLWARKCDSYLGDNPYALATDWMGNSYITGYFQATTTFGNHTINAHGYNDAFLVRYNDDGEAMWAKAIGGNNLDIGVSVCTDPFGYVYLTGFFDKEISFQDTQYSVNSIEVFIAKYWLAGDEVWTTVAGGGGSDFGTAIGANNAGELAVAGYYNLYGVFPPHNLPLSNNQDMFVAKMTNNVSIDERENRNFSAVFPNPSVGEIFIEGDFEKNEILTISALDMQGQIVFSLSEKPQNKRMKINIPPTIANGIYLLQVHNNMQFFSGKFILSR